MHPSNRGLEHIKSAETNGRLKLLACVKLEIKDRDEPSFGPVQSSQTDVRGRCLEAGSIVQGQPFKPDS